jgi:hypothetical protein
MLLAHKTFPHENKTAHTRKMKNTLSWSWMLLTHGYCSQSAHYFLKKICKLFVVDCSGCFSLTDVVLNLQITSRRKSANCLLLIVRDIEDA